MIRADDDSTIDKNLKRRKKEEKKERAKGNGKLSVPQSRIFHLYQSLEGPRHVERLVFRRWIGWSLRLMSLRMAVLGCQSGNALRRFANSSANRCATRSFAIKSRNAQGICYFLFFLDNKKKKERNVCQSDTQRSNMDPALRNHCVLPWHRRVAERVPGVYSYPHLS